MSLFENSKVLNEKVKYLLDLFGFDFSKIAKVIGIENKDRKKSFDTCSEQIFGKHRSSPHLFKKEDWIEQSEPELRKSILQYLGDYISKFRKVGWNHGNNVNLFYLKFFCQYILKSKNFFKSVK